MSQVTAQRMKGSPFESEQSAVQDLSGWVENSTARTWTFASANAGNNTFVVYASGDVTDFVRVTMRLRAKQGAGYQYFITHDVSAYDSLNDRTEVTLFGGDHSVLADAAITDVAFSFQTHPAGLPVGDDHWAVEYSDSTFASQSSPVTSTWYNINNASLDVPIGLWKVEYKVDVGITTSENVVAFSVSFSTANNTENEKYTKGSVLYGPGSSTVFSNTISNIFDLSLDDETTYYLNSMSGSLSATTLFNSGTFTTTIIRAVSAYY